MEVGCDVGGNFSIFGWRFSSFGGVWGGFMSKIYGDLSLILGLFGLSTPFTFPLLFREYFLTIVWIIPSIAVILGILGIVRGDSKRDACLGLLFGACGLLMIFSSLAMKIVLF